MQVALYCSDVSGAFDRLCRKRLLKKLHNSGLHPQLLKVFEAWLTERIVYVVVCGEKPSPVMLIDLIFQGSVLGRTLWNLFYADGVRPVEKKGFTESIFADDLNCFKNFHRSIGPDYVLRQIQECQNEVHKWGHANRVIFDPGKENALILDSQHPHGEFFEILGVQFDTKLTMYAEVSRTTNEASRRCHIVLKLRRSYSVSAFFVCLRRMCFRILKGVLPLSSIVVLPSCVC